jgi:hypothetical protein
LKNIEKNKKEKRGQSSKSYRTRTHRTQKNHVDHNQQILKNEEKTIAKACALLEALKAMQQKGLTSYF